MSQKNSTLVFGLSLLIAAGFLATATWFFREPLQELLLTTGILPNSNSSPTPSTPTNAITPPPVSTLPPTSPVSGTAISQTSPIASGQAFAEVKGVPTGLFNYGGSTTWAPLRRDIDPLIQQIHRQFQLRYTDPTTGAPGSGSGIKMLLDGELAFSQSSRPLKDAEYETAKRRGYTLNQIPVAIDGLAIAVHPTLQLPGLTVAQLQDIYTSRISNWNQAGGPNLPLNAYSRRPEEGGTVEFFMDNILEGKDFGNKVVYIPTTTQALREVARDPGGIYYASAPEVVPQCTVKTLPIGRKADELVSPYEPPLVSREICEQQGKRNQLNSDAFKSGDYPITRRLFVIVKENGQVDQFAGEAYAELILTPQGQDLVTQSGFVRIR